METSTEQHCTMCNKALSGGCDDSLLVTKIEQNLKYLVANLNCDPIKHHFICRNCIDKVGSACRLKILYSEKSRKLDVKTEPSSHCYSICLMCDNNFNPSEALPLFDSVSESGQNLSKYLSEDLESKILENAMSCEMCHKSLINFYNVINKLLEINVEDISDHKESLKLEDQIIEPVDENLIKMGDIQCIKDEEKETKSEIEDFHLESEEINFKMEEEEAAETEGESQHSELEKSASLVPNKKSCPKKIYKCSNCEYETTYSWGLKKHLLSHLNAGETTMFKCDLCEHTTKYKNNLQRHMLTHVVKIFKCEDCNFETKYKPSFMRHIRAHEAFGDVIYV